MSSTRRTIARAAKRRPESRPASGRTAMLVLETVCDAELEDVLVAIEEIHRRYCADCARRVGAHIAVVECGP